ncbi:SurA N-terminal domain-containing protein [Ornithinibacillus californiensis]|uniref:SurA N-terminal domain-containing protein n=1 Tax=Ornithinibacillus californiensis TaxID=161536 RepID=UPI00064DF9C1|nr:SurA N-terminal domain-containing protein [Ornithinibacillus californiensis]
MRKKLLVSIFSMLLLLVACSNNEEAKDQKVDKVEESTAEENSTQPEMPEPNLENVPDVVAEVNGEEVSKEEFEMTYKGQFQQALMQAQMTGQELDQDQLKSQVADALIAQKLVIQEAGKSGYEASKEDINKTIDSIVEQNGLKSQDEFFAALKEQGMGKEEVLSQVETQIKVDKLIASKAGDIEPTKEELQALYDSYKTQHEQANGEKSEKQKVPSYEEMESSLKEQAKSNKQIEVYQALVEELKADADITINL